jgi:hypothetical protein
MIYVVFILVISFVIIAEYKSKYQTFLYKCDRLRYNQLQEMGLTKTVDRKDKFYHYITYKYRKVEFRVKKRRYTFFNRESGLTICKGEKVICKYNRLPKRFKTEFYLKYLEVRYPRTFSRLINYKSLSEKASQKYLAFFKKEKLIKYSSIY